MNRKKLMVLACCLALIFSFRAVALAAEPEPKLKVGQSVGNLTFPKPPSEEDAKYLDLAKMDAFSLQDIKSPYVLVEQFTSS